MEPTPMRDSSRGPAQFGYDDRIVKDIQTLVDKYTNIDFKTYLDEAYKRYGFIETHLKDSDIISGITSWDTFIERLNGACQVMQVNLWQVDSYSLERKNIFDKTTACFLIVCKYVIENHSPNGDYAKTFFNSFMSSATIDFEPRYGTSNIENLRLYNGKVPLGMISGVHKSANELERPINENEFLRGIFETESIRNRVVKALAESPVMSVVLLHERASGHTYLSWLTRVKHDSSVDDLIKEMKTLVDEILNKIPDNLKMPLNAFISSIGETEKTLAALNEKLKHICSFGYFLNEFSADELMELLDVELIAGGILEICKNRHNQNGYIVYEAQNVLDLTFMRSNLILQVVQRIMQNKELFQNWQAEGRPQFLKQNKELFQRWQDQHRSPLLKNTIVKPTIAKLTTKIGKPVDTLPTYETLTKDHKIMITIIAEFLEIKSDYGLREVNEFFRIKKRKTREEPLALTVDEHIIQKTREEPPAPTLNIVVEQPTEPPLNAAEIQARENKIADLKQVLTDIVEVSGSYLTSIRILFAPYVEGVGSNFANIITNIRNQGSTYLHGAYNSAKSFVNRQVQLQPDRKMTWEPRNLESLKLLSAGNSGNSGISAGPIQPIIPIQPTNTSRKPNDLSNRERQSSNVMDLVPQKTGGADPIDPTSSITPPPPPPAPVYPTSQNDFKKTYGRISNLHHVPSNKLPITFTPHYRAPVSGGSMESNSINPYNVKDKTPSFPNINSIDPYYGRESLASSRATSPQNRSNSIQSTRKEGGKPRHSMSKNKKTIKRNPRKLISRRQKYSRRK